jgi:hypothetical protein
MSEDIIIKCPHCKQFISIEKINCGIFRHGMIIETRKQIDPHLPKQQCDDLAKNNKIFGCGKPFQIIKEDNNWKIQICDYI